MRGLLLRHRQSQNSPLDRHHRLKRMARENYTFLGVSRLSRRQYATLGCVLTAALLLTARYWGANKKAIELPTRWSKDVHPDNARPEYPRPQLRRAQWLNLNGLWELQELVQEDEQPPFGQRLNRQVLVPFPIESDLSGIREYFPRVWYRRIFRIPSHWDNMRILLNYGAVDWQCQTFLNGNEIGVHTGGYDKFSYDITDYLDDSGDNELILGVFDPTNNADGVPLGKQRSHAGHRQQYGTTNIVYTSSSGIWQTVWLEPVPAAHLIRADLLPDVDSSSVVVKLLGSASATGMPVQVTINEDLHGPEVVSFSGRVGENSVVTIPRPKLWSPDSPHLYQVDLQLVDEQAGGIIDQVSTYFGMRKVEVSQDARGQPRIKLNGRVEMNIGMLDQGFWPDGLYTAPTDEALAYDIIASKEMGFNVLRKHIKVEPDRWYYHADRLGIMVWQDMPSMCGMLNTSWGNNWYKECMNAERAIPQTGRKQFEQEMARHIEEHLSFPCIIMYVIFNEGSHNGTLCIKKGNTAGWGQYETERVTKAAMELDATRIYNGASGWNDAAVGHVVDIHDYNGVNAAKPNGTRASVLGEFGGLGLTLPKHTYQQGKKASSYLMFNNTEELNQKYLEYLEEARQLMLDPEISLSAIIYTELTDVEHEVNGWLTYDRQADTPFGCINRNYLSEIRSMPSKFEPTHL